MGFILILIVLFVLLSVAFFTLLEVRLLGLIHERLGPNKVGVAGYFQPFGDFVKLFRKSFWFPYSSREFFYFVSPSLGLLVGLVVWLIYLGDYYFLFISWGPIFFFCLRRIIVFYLLLRGWSSGSFYSSLGSFRSSAQTVSYEVVMIFIFFSISYFVLRYSFYEVDYIFSSLPLVFFLFPFFVSWLISCLAESSRSPFDFSEGESELVSGFNTEYMGGFFSFIFIAEYRFMLFLRRMTCLLFFGRGLIWLRVLIVVYYYILVRGAFPRLRFDWLMMIIWKMILPLVLGGFVFMFGFFNL